MRGLFVFCVVTLHTKKKFTQLQNEKEKLTGFTLVYVLVTIYIGPSVLSRFFC